MIKKVISTFATSFILAGSMVGCASTTVDINPDISAFTQINSVNSNNNFKYGLGCKLDGMKPMTDNDSKEIVAVNSALPATVDLRSGMSPIYHQGNSNACVGFSTVHGLGEYLARKKGITTAFSPRFLWNLGRKTENTLDENQGMWLNDAKKIMDNIGMLPEADFPFPDFQAQSNEDTFKTFYSEVPANALIEKAKKFRLSQGWVSVTSVHGMKNALAHGMPVVFAIMVYNSIANTKSDGIVPMPTENDTFEGGHAIVAVGYNNAKRQFIIRNSWGTEWGDKGYGYLSYDYISKGYAYKGQGLGYEGFTAKF